MPYCMQLESCENGYGGVNTFTLMNGFACGDEFYCMGMSVKKGVMILGLTGLIIKLIPKCLRSAKSM
jgi:hypothetical protein